MDYNQQGVDSYLKTSQISMEGYLFNLLSSSAASHIRGPSVDGVYIVKTNAINIYVWNKGR